MWIEEFHRIAFDDSYSSVYTYMYIHIMVTASKHQSRIYVNCVPQQFCRWRTQIIMIIAHLWSSNSIYIDLTVPCRAEKKVRM